MACPYRRDVAPGVWAFEEYEKLRHYDEPTFAQPVVGFACHATPDHDCHGWAVVHSTRGHEFELLALRLHWPDGGIPEATMPLFSSGGEAADHGQSAIDDPPPEATATMGRLLRKYSRVHLEDRRDEGGQPHA
jgi:hypothetical protein